MTWAWLLHRTGVTLDQICEPSTFTLHHRANGDIWAESTRVLSPRSILAGLLHAVQYVVLPVILPRHHPCDGEQRVVEFIPDIRDEELKAGQLSSESLRYVGRIHGALLVLTLTYAGRSRNDAG